MKKQNLKTVSVLGQQLSILCMGLLFVGCDLATRIERKAAHINKYDQRALALAKENRILKAQVNSLNSEIQTLKARNNFLTIKLEKSSVGRGVASIGKRKPKLNVANDLVKFEVYRWAPEQMLKVAEVEFKKGNYEKASQFYKSFAINYPDRKEIDDNFLFNLGVASYNSGKHYDWAINHFGELVVKYPTSAFYRKSKLWMALSKLKLGKRAEFFEHVEEFRLKYRNTPEWKILREHYEQIRENYKI